MPTPYVAGAESFGTPESAKSGVFQYDFPNATLLRPFGTDEKPDRISPSLKPEFGNTGFYSTLHRQSIEQHLLRMGFKFRDIAASTRQVDVSPRYRSRSEQARADFRWGSVDGAGAPKPIFRPLGDVQSKKRAPTSGRGFAIQHAPAASYRLLDYAADLPVSSFIGPTFRP